MRKFLKNQRGNVALIFALSLLPITLLVGGSVDLSRMRVERTRLQSATDAAALAASLMPVNSSDAAVRAAIDSFMAANYDGVITSTIMDRDGTAVGIDVVASVPMTFAALLGASHRPVSASARAERGGVNVEVALVLDVTGSMAGSRIVDLKDAANDLIDIVVQDVQQPYYTKMAIVPYSNAVNLGNYANAARGAVTGTRNISNIVWSTGSEKTPTAITRANNGRVTLSNHGYQTGDVIYFSGVKGMTELNGNYYTITKQNNNRFYLNVNTNYYGNFHTYGGNTARTIECANDDCAPTVTANNHGYSDDQDIYVTGVSGDGLTGLNNNVWTIDRLNANSFRIDDYNAGGGDYSSGGETHCLDQGCQFYRFTSPGYWWWPGTEQINEISTCVSERIGAQAYTDATPTSAPVGRVYPTNSDCPSSAVMPLSSSKNSLHTYINNLQTDGFTAGQIGIGWGWYMLAPNFGSLWPNASQRPVAYDAPETLKVAVLMTDGEFNAAYCNGVLASNYGGEIDCNATNGNPYTQAQALCDGMDDEGILVYTVGFGLNANSSAANFMRDCASDESYAYLASNGEQLNSAFRAIGDSIGQLRLTR